MTPDELKSLLRDVNLEVFLQSEYPNYAIFRVNEEGDVPAVNWMRPTFPESEVCCVLMTEGCPPCIVGGFF